MVTAPGISHLYCHLVSVSNIALPCWKDGRALLTVFAFLVAVLSTLPNLYAKTRML